MILYGFISEREITVDDLHLEDLYETTNFELNGEKIIAKLQDKEKNCLAELKIDKKSNSDENNLKHAKEVTQRWFKNHCKKVIKKGYKYTLYTSPDGKEGSYGYFMRELEKGFLHGLTCRV